MLHICFLCPHTKLVSMFFPFNRYISRTHGLLYGALALSILQKERWQNSILILVSLTLTFFIG